jgi:hypothetical protein
VVDQLLLHREPLAPAHAANLIVGPLAQLIGEGLKRHPIALDAAARTMHGRHARKIDIMSSVIQSTGAPDARHYIAFRA